MNEAVNESLKRLKTDYIDLYQLHSPERDVAIFGELDFNYNPEEKTWTPFEEILENLKDLINVGKIKYIGVSNETPWGILNYINISKTKKLPRITSVQNGYSLVNRVFDIANSEVSIREKCGLLAYSPLAGGDYQENILMVKILVIQDMLCGQIDLKETTLKEVKKP